MRVTVAERAQAKAREALEKADQEVMDARDARARLMNYIADLTAKIGA
jgi:hypothetical protein